MESPGCGTITTTKSRKTKRTRLEDDEHDHKQYGSFEKKITSVGSSHGIAGVPQHMECPGFVTMITTNNKMTKRTTSQHYEHDHKQ